MNDERKLSGQFVAWCFYTVLVGGIMVLVVAVGLASAVRQVIG